MIHPSHNLNIPQNYLSQLSPDNVSNRYRTSEKAVKVGLWERIKIFVNPGGYYKELSNFYPYHPVIKASKEILEEDLKTAVKIGAAVSVATIAILYQAARRGAVLPLLRQYGQYLKTHRIFRQYIWAAVLPTFITYAWVWEQHYCNVVQLWNVHARRLQKGVLSDPDGSVYPENVLPPPTGFSWKTPYISHLDSSSKLENEGPLSKSTLYANPEFENVEIGETQAGQEEASE